MSNEMYDVIIVGTGVAGYTAGIYASRYKMKNLIIGEYAGGLTNDAHIIGNYPGFEEITGPELMDRIRQQTKKLGTEEVIDRVVDIKREEDDTYIVKTLGGQEYKAKSVLLTIGTKRRKLGIPREDELYGKGVTYCATCDGFFYKNKTVAVVGGGDAANTASLYMADICPEVHQIVRSKMRGEVVWIDQINENPKITVHKPAKIVELRGENKLEAIVLDTGEEIAVQGLFIEIGSEPDPTLMATLGVETDEEGFIKVNADQSTNVPGLYAAGDITNASNKFAQIVTAAGEASVAINAIFEGNHG